MDAPTDTEAAAVWTPRDVLVPWDDNPRHNAEAVDAVARSIKRLGFGAPIVARKADNMVIAGHTRLLAAEKLGIDRVPVRFVDLDPADARLMALADNRVGEVATWDDDALGRIVRDLDAELGGLEDLMDAGFSASELDAMVNGAEIDLGFDGSDPDGFAPEPEFAAHKRAIFTLSGEALRADDADLKDALQDIAQRFNLEYKLALI